MKSAILILSALVTLPAPALAQDKKIALTFEEVPYMKPLGFWLPREISNLILRALKAEGVQAAGFVVQEKVEDDPSTYIVLSDWVTQDHILGNQTWGDADFNVLSYDHFFEHLRDGQTYLRRISKAHPFNYRYLRFPQLHEGNEMKKKKKLRKTLDRASYQIAHVTVKTTDWAFNRPYLEHAQDQALVERLKGLYLEHIGRSLEYSEQQSQKVFGRNISHILQLRCCIATAMFLPDLIQMLRQRGYQFVPFPEALSDPAFQTPEEYVGPLGLTFIDRVASSKGVPFDEEAGQLSPDQVEEWMKR